MSRPSVPVSATARACGPRPGAAPRSAASHAAPAFDSGMRNGSTPWLTARSAKLALQRDRNGARGSPEACIASLSELLLDGVVSDASKAQLTRYLTTNDGNREVKWNPADQGQTDNKVRGLAHLMMTLPEYQLA